MRPSVVSVMTLVSSRGSGGACLQPRLHERHQAAHAQYLQHFGRILRYRKPLAADREGGSNEIDFRGSVLLGVSERPGTLDDGQPEVDRIAIEDAAKARRDYAPYAAGLDRERCMLA